MTPDDPTGDLLSLVLVAIGERLAEHPLAPNTVVELLPGGRADAWGAHGRLQIIRPGQSPVTLRITVAPED